MNRCLFSDCRNPVTHTVQRLWLVRGKALPVLHACADHLPGAKSDLLPPALVAQTAKFYRVEPLPGERRGSVLTFALLTMADDVATRTKNAYSYGAYTPSGWVACCRMLARRGYNAREIEAVMRSKWTRWAGDSDEKRRYGKFTHATLEAFIDSMADRDGAAELDRQVAALIAETF